MDSSAYNSSTERPSQSRMLGPHGPIARICEHVPVLNFAVQEVHKRSGNAEALQRSRNTNPIGAHGYITRSLEYVPGVNNAVQVLHRKNKQVEAAVRAEQRNPVGASGYITQTAEHVAGANALVRAAHARSGKEEALERAKRRNPVGSFASPDVSITGEGGSFTSFYDPQVEASVAQEAQDAYIADNSVLGDRTPGMAFRLSRDLSDKCAAGGVRWGDAILGVMSEDGAWLQVADGRWLPAHLRGAAVLRRVAASEAAALLEIQAGSCAPRHSLLSTNAGTSSVGSSTGIDIS